MLRVAMFVVLTTLSAATFSIATSCSREDVLSKPKPTVASERKPVCDSKSFVEIATEVEQIRQKRRLSEEEFARMSKEDGTIVLDARSKGSYRQLRIKGSKNLPYTSFSEKDLKALIPRRSSRILIYCRNNLLSSPPDDKTEGASKRHPYPDELGRGNVMKAPKAALNIPTYITLFIYGYQNVWELDTVVDPNNSVIPFESE